MSEQDIDPDIIRQILDAAVCVPVHHRTNPWRFLVIRGAGRARLGDVMADHLAKDMDDPESAKSVRFLEKIRKKAYRAPVIIVAGAAKSANHMAIMKEDVASLCAACQNILLAAAELGLNAIWRTGSMAYSQETVASLGFEEGTKLTGFIYLGYPVKSMPPKSRQNSENFTRWMEN